MKVFRALALLSALLATVNATFPSTCFKQTDVFGRSDSSPVSDVSHLRSSSFIRTSLIKIVRICGTTISFEGIQLTLQDPSTGQQQVLNPIGRTTSCEDTLISDGDWITSARISYSSFGVNYIKLTTKNGKVLERGVISSSDAAFSDEYSDKQPLVGFNGFESSTKLTALGFIRFLCQDGTVPDKPNMPTTEVQGANIVVKWQEPVSGTPIEAYVVQLRKKDRFYSTELTHCDGSDSHIVQTKQCTIPAEVLYAAPFNQDWGALIYAKVSAINLAGESETSAAGMGARLTTYPDPPANLTENQIMRTASQLQVTWKEPVFNGGQSILDYTVSLISPDGTINEITGVTGLSYLFQGLTAGAFYQITVRSRNVAGLSEVSTPYQLTLRYRPQQVTQVLTENQGAQVKIQWKEPFDNAAPISSYKVLIYAKDGSIQRVTFDSVIKQTQCFVKLETLRQAPFSLTYQDPIRSSVIATNSQGDSDISDPGSGAIIWVEPSPPQSLQQVLLESDTALMMEWSEPLVNGGAPVLDYTVYSFEMGSGQQLAVLESGVTQTQYTAIGLNPGSTYRFRIAARSIVGTGLLSDYLELLVAKKPDPPLQLTVEAKTAYSVTLQWQEGQYNGGTPILDYLVAYTPAFATGEDWVVSTFTQRQAEVGGLVPGQQYSFYVKARNSKGYSEKSEVLDGVLAAQAPDEPVGLANDKGVTRYTKIGLTWLPPIFDGGSSVLDYQVWMNNTDNYELVGQNITESAYTVAGLMTGSEYWFVVRARNSEGLSERSQPVGITAAYRPLKPEIVEVTQIKDELVILWQEVKNGGAPVTEIEVKILDSANFMDVSDSCRQEALTLNQCTVSTQVFSKFPFSQSFKWGDRVNATIAAANEHGLSVFSDYSDQVVILAKPDSPQDFQEDPSSRTVSSLGVYWRTPQFLGGAKEVSFTLSMQKPNESQYEVIAVDITSESFKISGLIAGNMYKFKVQSKTDFGLSSFSNEISILCAAAPARPTAPTVQLQGDQALIKWQEPANNGSPITAYQVTILQHNSTTVFLPESDFCTGVQLLSTLQCYVPLSALTSMPYLLVQGEEIVVKVEAVNFYGVSPMSLSGSGDSIKLKPDAPRTLKNDLNYTSAQSIRFTWQPGQNDGGSPVIDYQIYYALWTGSNLDFVLLTSSHKQTAYTTAQELTPGQRYVFKVTARNQVGVSSESENIVIYAATVPDAPLGLVIISEGSNATQVQLQWRDGANDGGLAIGYYQITCVSHEEMVPVTSFRKEVTVVDLDPGFSYEFVVSSCSAIGCGPASSSITAFTSQVPDPPIDLRNMPLVTNAQQVGVRWSSPLFQGGLPILDYEVWQKQNSNYVLIAQNVTVTFFTIEQLEKGNLYSFKVKARNRLGLSDFSEPVEILTAQVPAIPQDVVTIWQQATDSVKVQWSEPDNNGGAPITSYTVFIRAADNTSYIEDLHHCDKVQSDSLNCQIPALELIKTPFNLSWGSLVYAKVIATNIKGNSSMSAQGSGATIITRPDPPTQLGEVRKNRTKTSLGLYWGQPAFNGGFPIFDYRVSFAEAGQPYQFAAETLTSRTYLATGLTPGLTYNFYVEARNEYGYSMPSLVLSMLCAFKPEAVERVSTYNKDDQLIVHWSSPVTNGSPITSYIISVLPHDESEFIEETSGCNGALSTVVMNRECSISLETLKAAPYNLSDHITVRVVAVNQYGESSGTTNEGDQSQGVILHVPDTPTNLQNDLSVTSATVIKLSWQLATQHPHEGAAVLDYAVYWDRGLPGNTFVKLASGVTNQFYVTGVQLTSNEVYRFKVSARNQVGMSDLSLPIEIRAAGLPTAPSQLRNVASQTNAYQISLSWSTAQLQDGGSPILDYRISQAISKSTQGRRLQTETQYTVVQAGITANNYTVNTLTPGFTYSFVLQSRNLVGFSAYSQPVTILAAQAPDPPTNLLKNDAETSGSQVGLQWSEPLFDGGSDIIDYRISMANQGLTGGEFIVIKIGVTQLQYTYKAVLQGETYRFRVEARNALGLSAASSPIAIVASQAPYRPLAPILTWNKNAVTISWQEPNDGGVEITAYRVLIRTSDLETYEQELDYCQTLQLSCQVPVSVLRSAPYDLTWGTNVHAKVIAINGQGESEESLPGSGAILITSPNAPHSLAEDFTQRTKSTIGFVWAAPTNTGGADIIDFRISAAIDGGDYSIIAQSVPSSLYTLRNVVPGQSIEVKVQARNQYGYSSFSDSLNLKSGFVPDAPWGVISQNVGSQIIVTWFEPLSNGAKITEYKIFIRKHVSSTFAEVSTEDCEGGSSHVLDNTQCTINLTILSKEPFKLVAGEQIYSKVVATNSYGDSAYSDTGFGSVMKTAPDAPFDLKNDITVTSAEQIKFTWRAGISNGGSQILDYTVYFDQGKSDFVVIASGITDREYTTEIALTQNQEYQFKVSARNDIGNSSLSEPLSVVAQVSELLPKYTDNNDGSIAGKQAATAAGAGAVIGIGGVLFIIVVTVLVTGFVIMLCCVLLLILGRRRFMKQVYPFNTEHRRRSSSRRLDQTPSQVRIAEDLTQEKLEDDTTKAEQPKIERQNPKLPGIERLEAEERIRFERDLLKGKTAKEKIKLLQDLQAQREKELQIHYKMERQQLRHDQVTANRRIQEQENIDNVFKAIYAEHEPQPQDDPVESARFAQIKASTIRSGTLKFQKSQKSHRADEDLLMSEGVSAEKLEEDVEALFFVQKGTEVQRDCDVSASSSEQLEVKVLENNLFSQRRITEPKKPRSQNRYAKTQELYFAPEKQHSDSQPEMNTVAQGADPQFLQVYPLMGERKIKNKTQIIKVSSKDMKATIVADEEDPQLCVSSRGSEPQTPDLF